MRELRGGLLGGGLSLLPQRGKSRGGLGLLLLRGELLGLGLLARLREALFRFRHILSGDLHEVRTCAEQPVVVETIPGWTHDITNIGEETMVSLLWASELFDRSRPDTVLMPL